MPYRYWLFIVALGFLTAEVALSQEPAPPEPEAQVEATGDDQDGAAAGDDAPNQQQERAPALLPAIHGIEAAIRDLIAEQRNQAGQGPGNHEVRDLDAQEKMATWAFWMFVATAATVVLTFAAFLAILRTLHHTKRAANAAVDMVTEAKAATTAAEATIGVTREIGQAQVRAYIVIGCLAGPDQEWLDKGPSCKISILNKGVSPAVVEQIEAVGFVADYPLPAHHELPDGWSTLGRNVVIHGGQPSDFVIAANAIPDPDERVAVIDSSTRRLYYAARAQYRDAVGSGYEEVACFSFTWRGGPSGRFENANKHNQST